MDQFFEYLKTFREKMGFEKVKGDLTESLIDSYLKIMKDSAVTDNKLEKKIEKEITKRVESCEELFHQLWLKNAFARHLCFRKKNYDKSFDCLIEALESSQQLFACQFSEFDKERKFFPLIILLNFARLSGYEGNRQKALKQLQELKNYLENFKTEELLHFEKGTVDFLKPHTEFFEDHFNLDDRSYFNRKIDSFVKKLERT